MDFNFSMVKEKTQVISMGGKYVFRKSFFFYRKRLFILDEGKLEGNRKIIFNSCWIC